VKQARKMDISATWLQVAILTFILARILSQDILESGEGTRSAFAGVL
jgi:hypothetical protein